MIGVPSMRASSLNNSLEDNDIRILRMWRNGMDTYSISKFLEVHESEIYNRLLHIRSQGE